MDREVNNTESVEEPKQPPKTITIDLNNIGACAALAFEIITRLAYFGVPEGMLPRDRAKASYTVLENIFKDIRNRLKTSIDRYGIEYDNLRAEVPGCGPQDHSSEQVGRERDTDSQV